MDSDGAAGKWRSPFKKYPSQNVRNCCHAVVLACVAHLAICPPPPISTWVTRLSDSGGNETKLKFARGPILFFFSFFPFSFFSFSFSFSSSCFLFLLFLVLCCFFYFFLVCFLLSSLPWCLVFFWVLFCFVFLRLFSAVPLPLSVCLPSCSFFESSR